MRRRPSVLLVLLVACAADEPTPPAAPTALAVSLLGAGAHLTWQDNANNEDELIIMRQKVGSDATLVELARVPFDTLTYHDEPITSGATYLYMVTATNAAGAASSNQATFVAP